MNILCKAALACLMTAAVLAPGAADAKEHAPVRVLVVADDSDPAMPSRSHPIYREVIDALGHRLQGSRFEIFHEGSLGRGPRAEPADLLAAARQVDGPSLDAVLIFSAARDLRPYDDLRRALHVRLSGTLVDLPSGRILEEINVDGVDARRLPSGCGKQCKRRRTHDLVHRMAPDFAEEVQDRLSAVEVPAAVAAPPKDGKVRGYSLVLQDFRPKELNRLLRLIHRQQHRADVWTVGETDRSRVLWVEVAAKPRQVRKAIRRMLDKTGVGARILRTERGFTVIRTGRASIDIRLPFAS